MASTLPILKISLRDKVIPTNKYLDVKNNHFEMFFFSFLRCCVVSMERMGLLPQALADDDKTEELERR